MAVGTKKDGQNDEVVTFPRCVSLKNNLKQTTQSRDENDQKNSPHCSSMYVDEGWKC